MDIKTTTRVLAALYQHDGLLTVETAKREGINKVTLKRAADAGVLRHSGRDRYSSVDDPPKLRALRGDNLRGDAVLSIGGAAYFWGLDGVDGLTLVWSVPHHARATLPNVRRRRNYARLEVVNKGGVVVTSVAQTLLDAGIDFDVDTVELMYESALRKRLVDDVEMRDFAAGHDSWQGIQTLRAVQDRRRPGERPTGSYLGTKALQLYRQAGMRPQREWEVRTEEGELLGFGDFGWPPRAFITEFDGLESHDLEHRQYDYNRQNRIEDLGYRFRRFTAEDVRFRSRYVINETRSGLATATWL